MNLVRPVAKLLGKSETRAKDCPSIASGARGNGHEYLFQVVILHRICYVAWLCEISKHG